MRQRSLAERQRGELQADQGAAHKRNPPLFREREAERDRQDRRAKTGSRIIMANLALSSLSYTVAFSASLANFPQQMLVTLSKGKVSLGSKR